jgi:hypothetical protein
MSTIWIDADANDNKQMHNLGPTLLSCFKSYNGHLLVLESFSQLTIFLVQVLQWTFLDRFTLSQNPHRL